MVKALFWMIVTCIILVLISAGLGVWKFYDLAGLWGMVCVLSVEILFFVITILLGVRVFNVLKKEITSLVDKVKSEIQRIIDSVKAMTFQDWVKALPKIIKWLSGK